MSTTVISDQGEAQTQTRGLFARLRDAWLGACEVIEQHRRLEWAIMELEQLDDRMLRDIGLTRADLGRQARAKLLRRIGQ